MADDFKYDVAFSFVESDRQLALQIADRIKDRVRAFVYSENMEAFAAMDGVDKHHRIYQDEARVVVVLHREKWGGTKWTRFEETAIKNRIADKGYDFLTVVSLDDSELPQWYPRTRITFSVDRFGIDVVAKVIVEAVKAQGGTVRDESAVDYAARIDRSLRFETERKEWYESERGVEAAAHELGRLFKEFQKLVEEIEKRTPQLGVSFSHAGEDVCVFKCQGIQLQIIWNRRRNESLKGTNLWVLIIENRLRSRWSSEIDTNKLHDVKYTLDWDLGRQLVWREMGGEVRLFTSPQLADYSLRVLIDIATSLPEDTEGTRIY